MATTLVNLNSHPLNIHTPEGEILTIPPSGVVARVSQETRDEGEIVTVVHNQFKKVEVFSSTFGDVVNLPAPKEGHIYVVSGMVLNALGGAREDVMAPGELIRSDKGDPIGCRGLRR